MLSPMSFDERRVLLTNLFRLVFLFQDVTLSDGIVMGSLTRINYDLIIRGQVFEIAENFTVDVVVTV